tara:strand:+ start:241 stop:471 length:231 start_codon:yes stop_codon:yes gene_type:complete
MAVSDREARAEASVLYHSEHGAGIDDGNRQSGYRKRQFFDNSTSECMSLHIFYPFVFARFSYAEEDAIFVPENFRL